MRSGWRGAERREKWYSRRAWSPSAADVAVRVSLPGDVDAIYRTDVGVVIVKVPAPELDQVTPLPLESSATVAVKSLNC